MVSLYLIRAAVFLLPILTTTLHTASATESQCYQDCRSSPRLVGPTRPSDEFDALGQPLRLTLPYPHHKVSENDYDFPRFCELGCTYFFVSSTPKWPGDTSSTLQRCMDQCDETYRYNVTIGYNDLLETARLECNDGCFMGLLRCQPGYFCVQVSFDIENKYSGGDMVPCPAGTYREVAYDQVSECVPCPPNHYREDVKGTSPRSCSKCPLNTSSRQRSTSAKHCVRCRAGTMSTEGGDCKCITPQACDERQLPFPADAEKRDSVPYIGRW